jgi:hypothetical protein
MDNNNIDEITSELDEMVKELARSRHLVTTFENSSEFIKYKSAKNSDKTMAEKIKNLAWHIYSQTGEIHPSGATTIKTRHDIFTIKDPDMLLLKAINAGYDEILEIQKERMSDAIRILALSGGGGVLAIKPGAVQRTLKTKPKWADGMTEKTDEAYVSLQQKLGEFIIDEI